MYNLRILLIACSSLILFPACKYDESTPAQTSHKDCVQCPSASKPVVNQTVAGISFEDETLVQCLTAQNIQTLTDLKVLYCETEPLTSLDGLQHFPNLAKIYVRQASNISLDFSILPNLEILSLYGDISKSIDVSKNINLKELIFRDPNEIKDLNLSNNIVLESLIIEDGRLETLTLPETDTLKHIKIIGTQLSSLNLTQYKKLKYIQLGANQLKTIALPESLELRELNLANNKLSEITIPSSPKLEGASFSYNPLKALSLKAPVLRSLDISHTEIVEFDARMLPNLSHLKAFRLPLRSLNLTNSKNLFFLEVTGAKLTELDLSENKVLEEIFIYDTRITKIDLTHNLKVDSFEYSKDVLKKNQIITGDNHPRIWEKVKY